MEPFKNLLGYEAAQKIAQAIHRSDSKFSKPKFLKNLREELEPLELKARMKCLSARLSEQLDPAFPVKTFPKLIGALKAQDNDGVGLKGFLVWPLTDFVATHGLNHFDQSMAALKEMTKVFTAEFAVRPFFIEHEDKTLRQFKKWSKDPNEHVRRLVSEGSRPFLPWGQKLSRFAEDPELTWPLLLNLELDKSKYVQKSVANHMNDISKLHGDWLVSQLKSWSNPWVVRHATRTLIKKGHRGALRLSGVSTRLPKIKSIKLKNRKVKLGESLQSEIELESSMNRNQKVIIDIEVHFLKKNGKHTPKVFKGKSLILRPGEASKIEISIPIKKVTTRTYNFGPHFMVLIVNGIKQPPIKFQLLK